MPRKPRYFLPNIPVHVVIRGNARQVIFADDTDRNAYLDWIKEASEKEKVNIHAYVLMDNHVHLLLRNVHEITSTTSLSFYPSSALQKQLRNLLCAYFCALNTNKNPTLVAELIPCTFLSTKEPTHISRVMQHIGRKYVPYFNHKYGRSGTLWEGRFKGSMIESEQYLLCCYRYIELNPVRANMVQKPEEWKWSSYAFNAYGEDNELIKPHAVYLAIDKEKKKRLEYYRGSFKQILEPSLINDLRAAVQTGTPLGNNRFKEEVEQLLGVGVGYARRGRPKKVVAQ